MIEYTRRIRNSIRNKDAHGEAGGEAPRTNEEQDKKHTVQDGTRDKNQRSVYAGQRGVVQSS
jgi:hypothetical protein